MLFPAIISRRFLPGSVYANLGLEGYRRHQEEHAHECLSPGAAFPFVQRLLALNDLGTTAAGGPLVEVILFSRNDPETGLRVSKSIQAHGLPISRRIFMGGRPPHLYMQGLDLALFLSANEQDVRAATDAGIPSGLIMDSSFLDDPNDQEIRLAFDFDGVLADDSAEQVFQNAGLGGFQEHETLNEVVPLPAGPLRQFLVRIRRIQHLEEAMQSADSAYVPRLRVSVITARNAPADIRAINSLKYWGVRVDEACFLGGIDKGKIAKILRPHIYFDDQLVHLKATSPHAPSVHIPYGILNRPALVAPASIEGDNLRIA